MAFTYDVSTDIGKVRLLISDTKEADLLFQDEEIQAFLDLNAANVKRAAAQALDSMAANQVMVLKVIRLLDLSTDGSAVERSLHELAKQLRDEADLADSDDGGLFDYGEMVTNAFTMRERVIKQFLREG